MLTKEQIKAMPPRPFEPMVAYTRFRNQKIVPESSPYFKAPRFKREFAPEIGRYIIKMSRGYYAIPKKKR